MSTTPIEVGEKGRAMPSARATAPSEPSPQAVSGKAGVPIAGKHEMLRQMVAQQIEREDSMSSFMVRSGLLHDILIERAELLEALTDALAVHGDGYSWGPKAKAAIAKARGQ